MKPRPRACVAFKGEQRFEMSGTDWRERAEPFLPWPPAPRGSSIDVAVADLVEHVVHGAARIVEAHRDPVFEFVLIAGVVRPFLPGR